MGSFLLTSGISTEFLIFKTDSDDFGRKCIFAFFIYGNILMGRLSNKFASFNVSFKYFTTLASNILINTYN